MALFQKGDGGNKGGGRRQGARNRISTALLTAFAEDFERFGEETVRITRIERPTEYLRIAASLIPQQLEMAVETRLQEISDDDLDLLLDHARRRLTERVADIRVREDASPHREPVALLSPLREAEGLS
jgi:hypothetical protein